MSEKSDYDLALEGIGDMKLVIVMFVTAANKFINKVETGRAVSKETYADLKACVETAKKLK